MNRSGGLWESFVCFDNLKKAAELACKARSDKQEVTRFLSDWENKLTELQHKLLTWKFSFSSYRLFTINDYGKSRTVAMLPLYPDCIVLCALCLVTEGPLNAKLIGQTYGSIKGRGYHKAVHKIADYLASDRKIEYVLYIDIDQFYASIDRPLLKMMLRTRIKDRDILRMLDLVIDSYPYDGLPKGNRTSPMLANLYLSELDHRLKERLHCHYYVRYIDDIAVLGYSKEWLWKIHDEIVSRLAELHLSLNPNCRIYPVSQGITFLGYEIHRDYIRLRKKSKLRMKKRLQPISERLEDPNYSLSKHDLGVIHSYEGMLSHCNGNHLRHKIIDPLYAANDRNLLLKNPTNQQKETEI